MRAIKSAVTAAAVLCLAFASQPANAARLSGADRASAAAPISSVGSRLDSAHPIAPSRPGAPAGLPYHVLDAAIYAQAKADAAQRAAGSGGPGSYARGDFSVSVSPSSRAVVQGSTTTYTVSTLATAGAARTVTLSTSGL